MKSVRNPDEVHTCWPPLVIIVRDGMEGYPPPRNTAPRGSGPACRLKLAKVIHDHAFSCGDA